MPKLRVPQWPAEAQWLLPVSRWDVHKTGQLSNRPLGGILWLVKNNGPGCR